MSIAGGAETGTVTCADCGSANDADERFCGHCGAYLEWNGSSDPPPSQAPDPGKGAPAGTEAAAEPDAPDAVQPAPEVVAAPRKMPVELDRTPLPGESVCGQCGAGNAATRRFCRRCGADSVDAVVVPRPPWYRRLFARERRPRKAGERPKVRRRSTLPRRLAILAAVVAIGFLAVRLAWPWASGPVEAVHDRLSGVEVVNPAALSASSSEPDHPAALARDGATNTFWSPTAVGDGRGEFVEAAFAQPFRLVALQFYNGSSEDPKPYLTTGRLESVLVTATTSDGGLETRQITLADRPGRQDVQLGIADVTNVRLTIVSAFGATPKTRVALGEVAYFRRS